ncbi:MAG TPA: SDR family oxidoreductase [Xanthobacteraceae bacterium]|nr:SDR family oxidoreductase [Xanthobacteraceae bacterium]
MPIQNYPKIVFVTGAGRGIGRAIALACAKAGSAVVCISKSDSCQRTSAEIESQGGKASAMRLDIEDHVSTARAVSAAVAKVGHVRIGVVAAAAMLGPKGTLAAGNLSEWERTFKVNVIGNLAVVQALLPVMTGVGFGRIVTLAGGGSGYAYPIFPAYAASKVALVRAVENLAKDLEGMGDIAVVCMAPGAIDTDMLAAVKAAGAEVRSKGDMAMVLGFIDAFMTGRATAITGRLVHVRDDYRPLLEGRAPPLADSHWKLRREE